MTKFLIIGLGGFIGAILRYSMTRFVTEYSTLSTFWGTLTVNILGCLILGVILQLADFKWLIRPEMKLFLIIGVLGSFTTFAAFANESLTMLKSEQYLTLVFNVTTQIVIGISALWAGSFIARSIKI
ncbi:MAG: fluoride efflux transporter CrcB [Candidatus Zixiibacteriota bacterium]